MSGDEPDRLRGLNLAGAGVDELASFRYPDDARRGSLVPAVRIDPARIVVATTPRPIPLLRDLASRDDGSVIITTGSTFDNAQNLSPAALAEMRERYEGTTLGEQELFGRLLTEVEGALWTPELLDRTRVVDHDTPSWKQVTLGIDPSSGSQTGDRQGLAVVGHSPQDGHLYVLASEAHRQQPWDFLSHCLSTALRWPSCRIILEESGASLWGDMLAQVQHHRGTSIPVQTVRATESKRARAQPVSGLWQQGKAHLVGSFPELESELTTWSDATRAPSPDLLDSLVWACWPFLGVSLGSSSGSRLAVVRRWNDKPRPADRSGVRGTRLFTGGALEETTMWVASGTEGMVEVDKRTGRRIKPASEWSD